MAVVAAYQVSLQTWHLESIWYCGQWSLTGDPAVTVSPGPGLQQFLRHQTEVPPFNYFIFLFLLAFCAFELHAGASTHWMFARESPLVGIFWTLDLAKLSDVIVVSFKYFVQISFTICCHCIYTAARCSAQSHVKTNLILRWSKLHLWKWGWLINSLEIMILNNTAILVMWWYSKYRNSARDWSCISR